MLADGGELSIETMNRRAATIGFFDGVHRGHLFLINQMCSLAKERGMESVIITFDRHPREVIHSDYVPQLLSSPTEKLLLLRQSGADHVEVLHFTLEMSQWSASTFMKDVLRKQLDISLLVMGYDHRFGHDGGSHEDYIRWGRECGIDVVLAHELEGEKVSSSRIRSLLKSGLLAEANAMLGYDYSLSGIVVKGYQIGRNLGFPTANLQVPPSKLLPLDGVYAGRVQLQGGGGTCPAVLNIGRRPTVQNGEDISVEAHLLHFSGNLYGQEVRVELTARLRDEVQFASTDELKLQIQKDADRALRLFER